MADEPRSEDRKARAATLFDVRRIIGGLLGLYGLLLIVLGATTGRRRSTRPRA